MSHHHIRCKTGLLQPLHGTRRGFTTGNLVLQFRQRAGQRMRRVRCGCSNGPLAVQHVAHAGDRLARLVRPQRHDLVAARRERGCDVLELTREVLVNEKESDGYSRLVRPAAALLPVRGNRDLQAAVARR
jgi:hypothetical protein